MDLLIRLSLEKKKKKHLAKLYPMIKKQMQHLNHTTSRIVYHGMSCSSYHRMHNHRIQRTYHTRYIN